MIGILVYTIVTLVSNIDAGMKSSVIATLICSLFTAVACFILWSHSAQFSFMAVPKCVSLDQVSSSAQWNLYWEVLRVTSIVIL